MLGGYFGMFLKDSSRQIMKNNNKNASWGNSLKYLPWDSNESLDCTEKMISVTVHEWYDAKHRNVSKEEIAFINSLEITTCPYCASSKIAKNGHYKIGYQQYLCKNCFKRFSSITNTIFDGKKIPISEWVEYLLHLFEFHSIISSARDNRNAESTGKYWLIKTFKVLEHIQDDVILEDKIYMDEMFFPVIKSKIQTKSDGKKLRGISRNKIAVVVAFDNHDHLFIRVENTSKPSNHSTWSSIGSHIKEGSHLIHDGEHSHEILVRNLNLTEEVYDTRLTSKMDDKDNPLDPINKVHALAKRFMRAHGGYDRDNLQDWMNLIWFIFSKPENRYEKIKILLNIAIRTPIRVKYRDVMMNNDDK